MVAIESHSARTGETRRLAAASEPQRKQATRTGIPFSPPGANAGHRFAMFAARSAGCPITPLSVKKSHRWRAPVRGRDAWFLLASFEPKILSRSAAQRKSAEIFNYAPK